MLGEVNTLQLEGQLQFQLQFDSFTIREAATYVMGCPMTRAALCTRLCDHLTSNWRPAWTPPDQSCDENWLLH